MCNVYNIASYNMPCFGYLQLTGFVTLNKSCNVTHQPDLQFFFEGFNANCSLTGFDAPKSNQHRMIR